ESDLLGRQSLSAQFTVGNRAFHRPHLRPTRAPHLAQTGDPLGFAGRLWRHLCGSRNNGQEVSCAGNRKPAFAERPRNPSKGEKGRGVARRSSGRDRACPFAAGGGRRASSKEKHFDTRGKALPRLFGGRGASV